MANKLVFLIYIQCTLLEEVCSRVDCVWSGGGQMQEQFMNFQHDHRMK